MKSPESVYSLVRMRISAAAAKRPSNDAIRLLAASKGQPPSAIRALAGLGQRAFGENHVQEALAKQDELADLDLEWHLIGPLQSNKCLDVARHFDWLQSLDRAKLIEPLSRHRPAARAALNVLIQVNIDAEPSKAGCAPGEVAGLARRIADAPKLRLRGIMAIPKPEPASARRRDAFRRVREIYCRLADAYPQLDTLSIGMSEDFELAIAEGASMVRIGSALFGPRNSSIARRQSLGRS